MEADRFAVDHEWWYYASSSVKGQYATLRLCGEKCTRYVMYDEIMFYIHLMDRLLEQMSQNFVLMKVQNIV